MRLSPGATDQQIIDRYVDKSAGPDSCWPWTAARTAAGYGTTATGGPTRRSHRVAWEVANDRPIPAGLFICHSCDNPPCCNPGHLFAASTDENMRDMAEKGRSGVSRGESHPMAKLSDDQVAALRQARTEGMTQRQLADQFGVSTGTVSNLVNRKYRASA
jgi:hypothetical protein